jgi:predicted nucleotidyltransferase
MKHLKEEILNQLCHRLLDYDQEIAEVILFGSSVYAPERAMDVDLLVFTKGEKDRLDYWDAIGDLLFDVDVMVTKVGESLDGSFAWQVLGAHRVLYGDGSCLREATSSLRNPLSPNPFEEAWAAIEAAKIYMRDAEEAPNEALKDAHVKDAFNKLFHAARLASMAYLATDETRWGRVKRMLPSEFEDEFQDFIDILHVAYFYYGKYPTERIGEEFEIWFERVKGYVSRLSEEAGSK